MTGWVKAAGSRGAGVHWFVAWRYLLARPRGLSGPILAVTALCIWLLEGFGLGASWFPLADELMSPFAVMPWWLLIGIGLGVSLVVTWMLLLAVRYVLYSPSASAAQRVLRQAFWVLVALSVVDGLALLVGLAPLEAGLLGLGGGWGLWVLGAMVAGALSRDPKDAAASMLLVAVLGGLITVAMFAVFDFFHRPYGSAGPGEVPVLLLVAVGTSLLFLVISAPIVIPALARRIRRGETVEWRAIVRGGRGGALGMIAGLLRQGPSYVGRYGPWAILGVDIAMVLALLAGAIYAFVTVLWPVAPGLPGGEVVRLVAVVGVALGLGQVLAAAVVGRRDAALLLRVGQLVLIVGLLATIAVGVLYVQSLAYSDLPHATRAGAVKLPLSVNIPMLVAGALLAPTILLAGIRYFFTFFSTVSIGGVAIGSMALVIVLSVMSGFENDLRRKILGSNAHMLVTKASDEPMICKVLPELRWQRCVIDVEHAFTEYRAIRAEVEKTPGVVASSPYLVSEVVIAANNNYANVIIKGVDPETIGRVSELDDNIVGVERDGPPLIAGFTIDVGHGPVTIDSETVRRTLRRFGVDPDDPSPNARALDKLWPLAEDGRVIGKPTSVPEPTAPPIDVPDPDFDDPAPDDLDVPDGVEPVDLSGGDSGGAGASPGSIGDDAPDDLDIPDDVTPVDLSGGPDGPDDPGPDAGPLATRELDIVTDLDERMPPLGDEFGPSIAREGLREAAREFTAAIPPRVAILPGVLVGKELVKQINLYDGQEVKVISPLGQDTPLGPVPRTKPFRVAGVFFTGMYEYDLKFIYIEIGALQDFLDLGDEVTGIEVRVADPENTGDVVAALGERLGPAYEVQDWKSLNRSLFSALKLEKIAMFLVLAIIILVASFSIVGNLIMVVVEKAREIAVLKTLGTSDTGVMKIFVTQGFFIGLVGTGVGLSLGLLACWAGIRFGLPLDPDVYYIDKLPIHVEPTSVGLVAAAGIIISVVATLYPAYIAARLRPIHGLRYE